MARAPSPRYWYIFWMNEYLMWAMCFNVCHQQNLYHSLGVGKCVKNAAILVYSNLTRTRAFALDNQQFVWVRLCALMLVGERMRMKSASSSCDRDEWKWPEGHQRTSAFDCQLERRTDKLWLCFVRLCVWVVFYYQLLCTIKLYDSNSLLLLLVMNSCNRWPEVRNPDNVRL